MPLWLRGGSCYFGLEVLGLPLWVGGCGYYFGLAGVATLSWRLGLPLWLGRGFRFGVGDWGCHLGLQTGIFILGWSGLPLWVVGDAILAVGIGCRFGLAVGFATLV